MKLSNAFYNAVKEGNILRVRIMMTDSLMIDKTFERFNEMERTTKNMKGLYDEHDGKQFVLNRSLRTEKYIDTLMVEVINNFSHERINHIKDTITYIYKSSDNIKNICNNIENRIKKELNIDINNLGNNIERNINKEALKKLLMNRIKKELKIE